MHKKKWYRININPHLSHLTLKEFTLQVHTFQPPPHSPSPRTHITSYTHPGHIYTVRAHTHSTRAKSAASSAFNGLIRGRPLSANLCVHWSRRRLLTVLHASGLPAFGRNWAGNQCTPWRPRSTGRLAQGLSPLGRASPARVLFFLLLLLRQVSGKRWFPRLCDSIWKIAFVLAEVRRSRVYG